MTRKSPKRWTDAEIELLRPLFEAGEPIDFLAEQFSCHSTTIYAAAKRHGFWRSDDFLDLCDRNRKFPWTDDQIAYLRTAWADGELAEDISFETGACVSTIQRKARELGLKRLVDPRRRAIEDRQRRLIRALRQGKSVAEAAAATGYSHGSAKQLVARLRRDGVELPRLRLDRFEPTRPERELITLGYATGVLSSLIVRHTSAEAVDQIYRYARRQLGLQHPHHRRKLGYPLRPECIHHVHQGGYDVDGFFERAARAYRLPDQTITAATNRYSLALSAFPDMDSFVPRISAR